MSRGRWRLVLLAVVFGAQILAAASVIFRYERTLSLGTLYRAPVTSISVADPVRGRSLEVEVLLDGGTEREPGRSGRSRPRWVQLSLGPEGRPQARLVESRPREGDYFRCERIVWEPVPGEEGTHMRRLAIPANRYYLPEAIAAAARLVLDDAIAAGTGEATARLRVYEGIVAIEGIDVDGVPIEAAARGATAGRVPPP